MRNWRNDLQMNSVTRISHGVVLLLTFVLANSLSPHVHGQTLNKTEQERAHKMLADVVTVLRKYYYDPRFKGLDLDALAQRADGEITKAQTVPAVFAAIADFLRNLHDSHTYFLPPSPRIFYRHEWTMQNIGDNCYVTAVKEGSDGATKGLKPGDQILALNGIKLTRDSLPLISYFYFILNPQVGFDLDLINTQGERRVLRIMAKEEKAPPRGWNSWISLHNAFSEYDKERRRANLFITKLGEDISIWQMGEFELADAEIDEVMVKVRNSKALILDLRNNPGGLEDNVLRLAGYFFDHDVTLGTLQRRDGNEVLIAKSRGKTFKGKLIILVDSESTSASELFARVMQLEQRAIVIGDQTGGKVMRGITHYLELGTNSNIAYAVNVTDSNIIMRDGKGIEDIGVTPDEIVLPTAADLAQKRDPVLSRAASLLGKEITPDEAYKLLRHKPEEQR
jgi:C-terminal processing protease CtpA/Prc